MKLSNKEREVLNWLAREAQTLSNTLKDASQLSEKGHFLASSSLDNATTIADKINTSLVILNSSIGKQARK